MTKLLKRQLNEDEKQQILDRFGRKCFANGHEIPESETIQFDHITAYARGGPTEIENIAPMCAKHNREKGTLPLDDFRVKLLLQDFFGQGDKLTLKHLLRFLRERKDLSTFGEPVHVSEKEDGKLTIESASNNLTASLYTCPTTKWKYFYATLDVSLLDSDDDSDQQIGLQPRYLIQSKVFDMFRHFQLHPVLQPSVGRFVDDHFRLFDGQHKIAGLLLTGRRKFECKVYLDADVRLLNQTNISAHDKFAQTRFYSSIMILKLGSQFGVDFEEYKNLEDSQPKSESGFLEYLAKKDGALSRGDLRKRFRSYIYSSVLEHDDSKLSGLVSASNRRSAEKPLTMDMLEKSLFARFLFREPTTDNMATDAYKRDVETQNVVNLMNMFFEAALSEWDSKASPNDLKRRRLERIFGSKSMMGWAELVHGAVCGKLELQDVEEREKPFYRHLDDGQLSKVRSVIDRLVDWQRWNAPAGDSIEVGLAGSKGAAKSWLKENGLTTGYLMGATE